MSTSPDPILARLHHCISQRLEEIGEMFIEPVKITIVIRNPAHPAGERDVMLSNDDLETSVTALRRVASRGLEVAKGATG